MASKVPEALPVMDVPEGPVVLVKFSCHLAVKCSASVCAEDMCDSLCVVPPEVVESLTESKALLADKV